MLGENKSIVPNFTYYPSPNPNPNSPSFLNSPAYNHAGVVMSETTNVSPVMHSAGSFGVMTRPMMNIIQPYACEVCHITCNTWDVFEKHKKGKKHLKNMQKVSNLLKMPEPSIENAPMPGELENKKLTLLKNGASVDTLISCDICNVICNNQDVFQAHIAGKRHCAKAVIQAANANGLLEPTSAPQNKPDNTYHCGICKISCTSGELLNLHLAGKKHQKKIKESDQIPVASPVASRGKPVENAEAVEGKTIISQEGKHVPCELCGIICSSYEVLKTHISGKKHQKNLEKSEKLIGPYPPVPVTESVTEPLTKPVTEPLTEPVTKPVTEPVTKPVMELVTEPVIESVTEPVIEPVTKPVIELVTEPVIELVTEPVIEPVTEAVTEPVTKPVIELVTDSVIEPATEPVTEPTREVTPMVIGPQKQDSSKEEVIVVKVSGSKKKTKRRGNHEDVETKKRKILQGGGTVDAMRTCTVCQVVCSSPDVYISHLAGSKHAAMAVKQAEAQAQATGEET